MNKRLIARLGTLAAGTAAVAAALRSRQAPAPASPERRPIGSDGPAVELVLTRGRMVRSADGHAFTVYSS